MTWLARLPFGWRQAPTRAGRRAFLRPDRRFPRAASRVAPRVWRGVLPSWESVSARVSAFDSSFSNNLRGGLVVAHPNKGAVPKLPAVRPSNKRNLTHQRGLQPPTLFHLVGSERLAPTRCLLFWQIYERAAVDDQLCQGGKNLAYWMALDKDAETQWEIGCGRSSARMKTARCEGLPRIDLNAQLTAVAEKAYLRQCSR